MLIPAIVKAVSKRLTDESISVREAAVSLVGNYIARSPQAIQSYHSVLVPCMTDLGVSVRKRALKIFHSILTKNPSYRGRATVFNILLQRLIDPNEEDSLRDLVHEVICMLWFRSGTEPMSRHIETNSVSINDDVKIPVVSIPGVVTPNTPVVSERRKKIQSKL